MARQKTAEKGPIFAPQIGRATTEFKTPMQDIVVAKLNIFCAHIQGDKANPADPGYAIDVLLDHAAKSDPAFKALISNPTEIQAVMPGGKKPAALPTRPVGPVTAAATAGGKV